MRHGFIREPEEIKYLIMYCLSFMPFAVSENDILDMVLVDEGFGYFEFSEAFLQLQDTRHVSQVTTAEDKEYILTPKGFELIDYMSRQLPSTVRDKAEKAAMRVMSKIRRDGTLKVGHRQNGDGSYTVTLQIRDKNTQHLSLEMMVMTQRQCALIEDNFKRNAENVYLSIIQLLSGE